MTRGVFAFGIALAVIAAPAVAWGASENDPAALVDPLVGTSTTAIGGPIDTFPGADTPFGMIQWSPDTPSEPAGGGYSYNDGAITDFSLTHLSGPGCSVFGDIGFLPVTGPVVDPASANQPFTHAAEIATPGYYEVYLGDPGIRVQLAVTTRTGLGAFTFPQPPAPPAALVPSVPQAPRSTLLVNASSNQAGVADAGVRVVGDDQLTGSAQSGWFCGMPGTYRIYFAAQFNRPFAAYGTWRQKVVTPGSLQSDGAGSGAYLTFDTSADPVVKVKVSVSWVSVDGALANLRAEATTWDVNRVRRAAAAMWSDELGRVRVGGGSELRKRVFYTELYHALLHPNVYSDADGEYRGFDETVHRVAPGHTEYANFSGWDVYRTQIPLIALLDPKRTSDIARSFVHAAQQGGWLPKWSLANTESAVMGGDPADPALAGAYAFGARDFDVRAALQAMLKGATQPGGTPGQGWYHERPGLDEYLQRGYVVNVHTTNVAPVANGASLTLEYSLDDFSIAQFAKSIGRQDVYAEMMARAQNWSTLFDQSLGLIAPRDPDGAFVQTSITENGQSGFQEGNAAQYTWMVPQDLAALIDGMGGRQNAAAKLDAFFGELNADQDKPYAWLGNEPSLGSPFAYLTAGVPWKEQRIVRVALTQFYGDTPDGLPGNDDLGTMSAWFVWCALGIYPQNPSVGAFDLSTPLFPSAKIRVPNGVQMDIDARGASDDAAFIQSVSVNGSPWTRSWIPLDLRRPTRIAMIVGSTPNQAWASAPADAPPSFATGAVRFPPSTAAALKIDGADEVPLSPGGSNSLRFGVANSNGSLGVSVAWQAALPDGFTMTPPNGTLDASTGAEHSIDVRVTAGSGVADGLYDLSIAGRSVDTDALVARVYVVAAVRRGAAPLPLAYVANFFDNSVTPFDLRTHAFGVPILVGENPREMAMSPDRRRLYVANNGSNDVSVIDIANQAVVGTVAVGKTPWGIVAAPDGKTVWVANYSDDTVQPIDTSTLQAGAPIAVGHQPEELAVAPDGSTLYVADEGSNDVMPVDLRSRSPLPPIAVGARPRGIAISPDGRTIFASGYAANSVTPIDTATKTAGPPIAVGVGPRGLAFSPDGARVYVADFGAGTVTPIDVASRQAHAPIQVGLYPVAVGFDAAGATAYVVAAGDNDCVPVDVATGTVGAPIMVGDRPLAIAR